MHLSATAPAPQPAPALQPAAVAELRVGAVDIGAKEVMLLRSLIRLLDLRIGLHLQFMDDAARCNVLFVPAETPKRWPAGCVTVHMLAEGAAPVPGLCLQAPLRTSNVTTVLQAAGDLLAAQRDAAQASDGLAHLFLLLARHLMARDRRNTVVPLRDGSWLMVDFAGELVHAPLTQQALLAGHFSLLEPRRASAPDLQQALAWPALPLRPLLWAAVQTLGDAGTACTPLQGRYRLLRWPEAAALLRPGLPRLVALLTTRPMTLAEASAASGTAPALVRWFLEACLALGLAVPDHAPAPAVDVELPPTPARSLLGRLRERLKLW